jgi:hypothetical protein
MPVHIVIPAIVAAAAILTGVALGPSIWLTRSPRALGFRRARRITVLLWCLVAALPWTVVLIAIYGRHDHNLSISVSGVPALLVVILKVLVVFAALVSLPLAAIIATTIWFLDRNAFSETRTPAQSDDR